jgi:hypothetical protein
MYTLGARQLWRLSVLVGVGGEQEEAKKEYEEATKAGKLAQLLSDRPALYWSYYGPREFRWLWTSSVT